MKMAASKTKLALVVLSSLYLLLDTALGGIIGVIGYFLLSMMKVNLLVRELFFWVMLGMGLLYGIVYSVKCCWGLCSKKDNSETALGLKK